MSTDAGPLDPNRPRIEVGGGLSAFEPFGEDTRMVLGLQGGWHIDVSSRFFNIDAVGLPLTIEGFDVATGQRVTFTLERLLQDRHSVDTGDGVRTRTGDRLILDISSPEQLHERKLRIVATGQSQDGTTATGEANVVVLRPRL